MRLHLVATDRNTFSQRHRFVGLNGAIVPLPNAIWQETRVLRATVEVGEPSS